MSTSDIRWTQHPFLHMPDDQLEAHSREWAFVVLLFTPPKQNSSLKRFLLNQMRWTVECTRLIESAHSVESIQQDGLHLTFLFQNPQTALSAAINLLSIEQNHFHIGAGFGPGYEFDHFKSLQLIQMKTVLPYGNIDELQISNALKTSIEIPHGIGAFQCSPALAQKTGMNYWILKDYR